MGPHPSEALAVLRAAADDGRLAEIVTDFNVRLLGVFGSVVAADPPADPHDLDVAVVFEDGEGTRAIGLLDAIVALTGYDHIDLAIVDGSHPVLDAEALCGEPLYEREAGAFAQAQMAAIGHRRDTAWLRQLDLQRMAG